MPVEHYENFPVASVLLPRSLREPIEAIYAFARSADDIADEGSASIADRLTGLQQYDEALSMIAAGGTPVDPMFTRLAKTIRDHSLPIELFTDLIDAFRQDVTQTRYESYAQLLDYCRRSANPIGRLLLLLTGNATPQNLRESDAICTSLQLINHWQDVAVDWKKNQVGRVYLPQEDLRRFHLTDADIATASTSKAWQEMMHFQTSRARSLMHEGAALGWRLSGRFGLELRLIVFGGLAILDKIDAVNGDVFRHRPVVTKWDWLHLIFAALLTRRSPATRAAHQ